MRDVEEHVDEENTDEEDRPIKRMMPWFAGGLGIGLLYFVSFGPVVYTTMKFDSKIPDMVNHALEAIYFPHTGLMYHSEGYFNYVLWWATSAKSAISSFSHKQFREDFERRK